MSKLITYLSIAVCCFGIAMATYTTDVSRFFMHLGNDSKACINCHTMNTAYTTWEHGIHGRNTTCVSCHLPKNFVDKYVAKAVDGLHHVYKFTSNNYGQSIKISKSGAKTVQKNCISCHESKIDSVNLNKSDNEEYCWRCHREISHANISGINMTPNSLGVKNLNNNHKEKSMKKYLFFALACIIVAGGFFLMRDIERKEAQRYEINTPKAQPKNPYKISDYKAIYPRQYESYISTSQSDKFLEMFDEKPNIAILRAGEIPAGTWWGHHRGKYFSNIDLMFNIISEMPTNPKDESEYPPSRCLVCHSSDTLRLIERDGRNEFFTKPLAAYGNEAQNPIGCSDCHDPKTMALSVKRDHLDRALKSAGMKTFDESSHQEKRSLVCAQCHVLSYTTKEEWADKNGTKHIARTVTLPWAKGLSVEQTEAYYDDPANFGGERETHIVNMLSKAPTLLAEHPDFELYQKSVHAKNNVSCADCHMPYVSEGGTKFTNHQIGSPLKNMEASCLTCHPGKKDELTSIISDKKQRFEKVSNATLDNIAKAHLEAKKAWEVGAKEDEMKEPLDLIRKAQWRYTYVESSLGAYMHATDESLRIFADANDFAQKARIQLAKILTSYNASDFKAPEFNSKDKIFAYLQLPERESFIKEKCQWIDTTGRKWLEDAKKNGTLTDDMEKLQTAITWYDHACKDKQ